MIKYSERLKKLRQKYNLSQADLGMKISRPRATISAWETGNRAPDIDDLIALADFYGVTIDYLSGRSDVYEIQLHKDNSEDFSTSQEFNDFLFRVSNEEEYRLLIQQLKKYPSNIVGKVRQAIVALDKIFGLFDEPL